MSDIYGIRDISKKPSLLKIDPHGSFIVEDKKSHKKLGVYMGMALAEEFMAYMEKKRLLDAAKKIRSDAEKAYESMEGSIDDGL
jgi:hypothetical protein